MPAARVHHHAPVRLAPSPAPHRPATPRLKTQPSAKAVSLRAVLPPAILLTCSTCVHPGASAAQQPPASHPPSAALKSATKDDCSAQLAQLEREEHERIVRNTPPLEPGIWSIQPLAPAPATSPAAPQPDGPAREAACCTPIQDLLTLLPPNVDRATGGVSAGGLRVHSDKLSGQQYRVTPQVFTSKGGLSIARHQVTLANPAAFTDPVVLTSRNHTRQAHFEAHWLRECPC